jgi:hypothetical protein
VADTPLLDVESSPLVPDVLTRIRTAVAHNKGGVFAWQGLLTRAALVRHEVVFETAWLDWNPDQVLRVAAGILRKQASDGMPRNPPGLLPEV